MKLYNLTIGERITAPKITNTTEIVIEYMHGDADQYTTKSFKFPTNENPHQFSINDIIFIMENWFSLNWNLRCELCSKHSMRKKWLTNLGYNPDIVYDLFEYDITSDDNRAHIESCKCYWYDENGIKYKFIVNDINNNKEIVLQNGY
jgi:hypothetical protein